MNLFKSLKNRKGMSGAVKGAMLILTLAFIVASASYIIPVLAVHTDTVTIAPEWEECSNVAKTYTVTVTWTGGDDVREVRIFNNTNMTVGYKDFQCDPAPAGWTLVDQSGTYSYCQYQTFNYLNATNPTKTFTITVTPKTSTSTGVYAWKVQTLDITEWIGNINTYMLITKLDCKPPVTTKTYGTPTKVVDGYRWINSSTPITLTALDDGPYGLGDGVGVDKIQWRITKLDIKDSQCTETCSNGEYFGQGKGDWNESSTNVTFTIPEDSCHLIEFYANDTLGNTETPIHRQCVFVDNKPPVVEKTVGDPKLGTETEFQTIGNAIAEWSTDDSYNGDYSVKLYVSNGTHDMAAVEIPVDIQLNQISELKFLQKIANDYGVNVILGVDANGDGVYEAQDKLWHIGATQHDPGVLGGDSFVEMDGLSPSSGSWEEVNTLNIQQWWTPNNDGNGFCPEFGWNYLSDIQSASKCRIEPTDHVKVIKLLIGGSGSWMDKIAFVDYLKLNGNITLDEPLWIGGSSQVTLTCGDPQPHPVDNEKIYYRYFVDGNMIHDWQLYDGPITFGEDSNHTLQYYCEDALGNKGETKTEDFKVDSTPPTITKTIIGPSVGDCLPRPGHPEDKCYIKDTTGGDGTIVHVEATDPDPTGKGCNVNQIKCEWGYYLDGKWSGMIGDDVIPPFNITFNEDSNHTLVIKCWDKLKNIAWDNETFLVDSLPPITTKTYGNPHYPSDINSGAPYPHYINSSTPVTLTATDVKVGVDRIYWRDTVVEDRYCSTEFSGCQNGQGSGSWNYTIGNTTTFYKPEESCHIIEYYAVDKLGNNETIKKQCVFVDNKPPNTTKTVGDPKIEKGGYVYITNTTPITLTCTDQQPHPVDHSSLKYRYRFANNCGDLSGASWSNWQDPIGDPIVKPVTFPEDSCHELEYYCVDALGNAEDIHSEIDVVDSKPPVITKAILGPMFYNATQDKTYLDGVTIINVNAYDPTPHPVDGVKCEAFYYLDGGATKHMLIDDTIPPFNITFPEETKHELHVKCWDGLKNKVEDIQTYYVDKTPPVTTKTYGNPKFSNSEGEWISSSTLITLTVNDAGPHKTGIKETKYRVTLVGDDYCNKTLKSYCDVSGSGTWNMYTAPFTIGQQSCHVIEYYSVDNVNKTETTKKQCVYVDNTPPTPAKDVGEPEAKWTPGKNGEQPSFFYPEETKNCWATENSIDCWKVTTLTPISLQCTDPQPHPVDHEKVCFNVEVDGCDKTEDYCDKYHGKTEFDEKDNMTVCCLNNEIENFHFKEETEHNLKYYCVDALGNKGPVDEEKFKVEGTKFEISLYKKWNLISVPFTLLDNNPATVFNKTFYEGELVENVSDYIGSVWTYDPEHAICGQDWCVWSPGEAPGNLKIEPGWGYWVIVKAKPEDCGEDGHRCWFWNREDPLDLVIGGSLFSPATTPPSRNLVKGWNLIGYYGTNWEEYKGGTNGQTCGPGFNWFKDKIYGSNVYCSLNSLIDTQEGYPRWSSLWSYVSCGNDKTYWLGLNTCADQNNPQSNLDKMYAGRGYWVELDVPDMYAPATTCIWNSDFQCVWTGGGLFS